jgi:hypothetical protein
MVYACLVVLIALSSCRTADVVRQTYVRDTVVVVQPITVHDTVPVIVHDSVVIGMRVRNRDTVVRVEYVPARRTMSVMVRTDTLRIRVRDTVRVESPVVVRDVIPWWCYACALLLIVVTLGLLRR